MGNSNSNWAVQDPQYLRRPVPCIFQPMISEKFKIHDTCGVNNLHGMPGILAGIIGAIVVGLADEDDYGYRYKGSFTRAS